MAGFDISIHAPVKGATSSATGTAALASDFNPRSREGSDQGKAFVFSDYDISIHAPVKGATPALCDAGCRSLHFNPRSREGSDRLTRSHP